MPASHIRTSRQGYPCHCCHKKATIYWLEKRQTYVCGNCLKTFHPAVISKRNGVLAEQLSLC